MLKKTFFTLMFLFTAALYAGYTHIEEMTPGQIRFSSKNVEEKVVQALLKGDAFFNPLEGTFIGKYYGGKSLFPEEEALPVVKGRHGYVLADGHHHVLTALALGLPWVPTKEIADLSHLAEDAFWVEMEQKGWVHLYGLDGVKRLPPADFNLLEEDPNRYFAAITARKCGEDGNLSRSRGAEYPLWIKVGKDIPFIEFKISDALFASGFRYEYNMGNNPDEATVEEARCILIKADIPGLRLVKERKHWKEISLSDDFRPAGV
ncbi:MAG: ParB/Srx family N-terminal domain-containing protein [Chlamydiales bacterium]|nr:ParB/Srx family N-terminal domain-containing protein [Chlamydiales bacterium]